MSPRRIVLSPIGSRGDIQPMLALALELRARGHDVTFAAPENFSRWVDGHGLRFAPVGGDVEADLKRHGDRLHGSWHQTRVMREEVVPRQFRELPDACAGAELLVGAGLQLAGPSVAQVLGIPYAFIAYAPPVIPSGYHPPPVIRTQSLPRVVNHVLWGAFATVLSVALAGPINRGRRALGLPRVHDIGRHLTRANLILAADQALTGPVPDLAPEVHWVPALRLEDSSPLPREVTDFLDAGPPPVLVGFGSMVTDRGRELAALFAEAGARAGIRMVIQAGWTGLRHSGAFSPTCLFAGAMPHGSLLPRVAAVVHHGGAGTTASVARAGRPQLILPYLLDQFYWAGRIQALGLGPRGVPIGRVRDAGRLAGLLGELTATPRYRESAARMKARIPDGGVAAAAAILERVEQLAAQPPGRPPAVP
jgi:UDP:flavonoid glycosyltransferase YjiC (YdhE family)